MFVLGEKPGTAEKAASTERDFTELLFRSFKGHYKLYDELIDNAKNQYDDYVKASAKVKTLNDLLNALGGPSLTDGDGDGASSAKAKSRS